MSTEMSNQVADSVLRGLEVASRVPDIGGLQSLAGGVLAVCIAYLALPSFRYRDRIESYAASVLSSLDGIGAASERGCKNHYARLVRLAGNKANQKQMEHLNGNRELIEDEIHQMPGDWIFNPLSPAGMSHDRAVVLLIGIFSTIIISSGSARQAHLINMANSGIFRILDSYYFVVFSFFACMFSIALPLWYIKIGNSRVSRAAQLIESYNKNCLCQLEGADALRTAPTVSPVELAQDQVNELKNAMRQLFEQAGILQPVVKRKTQQKRPPKEDPGK